MKRALLIINRKARQAEASVGQAVEHLRGLGFQLFEEAPAAPGSLRDTILGYRGRVDLVIVGGGDGTMNAAVEGLIESGLPLGILPLGTANDLARTLDIPPDLPEACNVIAAGHTRRIDLGWVNGKHFFNVASMGLSVEIARKLSRESKSRWGWLAYLLTAVKVIWNARPFRAEIRHGGEAVQVTTVQIAVGNGRYYGGGMTVAEDAAIDDSRLDLYSLEIDHWWQIIPLLPAMRAGSLASWPRVRTLRGQELEIIPRRSRAVNTDGEITQSTPARFRVLPRALEVFVPRPATEPAR